MSELNKPGIVDESMVMDGNSDAYFVLLPRTLEIDAVEYGEKINFVVDSAPGVHDVINSSLDHNLAEDFLRSQSILSGETESIVGIHVSRSLLNSGNRVDFNSAMEREFNIQFSRNALAKLSQSIEGNEGGESADGLSEVESKVLSHLEKSVRLVKGFFSYNTPGFSFNGAKNLSGVKHRAGMGKEKVTEEGYTYLLDELLPGMLFESLVKDENVLSITDLEFTKLFRQVDADFKHTVTCANCLYLSDFHMIVQVQKLEASVVALIDYLESKKKRETL